MIARAPKRANAGWRQPITPLSNGRSGLFIRICPCAQVFQFQGNPSLRMAAKQTAHPG
jgi:hypothetical protein